MKNIHQLAKLARRIPRVHNRGAALLRKQGATSSQVQLGRALIAGATLATRHLAVELAGRNIEIKGTRALPYRDCTPHKDRLASFVPNVKPKPAPVEPDVAPFIPPDRYTDKAGRVYGRFQQTGQVVLLVDVETHNRQQRIARRA